MKKIIAAAVATAFVAPAFANPTINGEIGYVFTNTDKLADSASAITNADANFIAVKHTSELDNGLTVTGVFQIEADQGGDDSTVSDGGSLSIAGGFGKLSMGDVAGAADAVGDYTDVAAWFGGYGLDGVDHAVSLTVNPIDGLTTIVSYSPSNVDNIGESTGVKGDVYGYSAKYAIGGGEVYYATETYSGVAAADQTMNSYGVKYSFNGIMVAYEAGSEEVGGSSSTANSIWGGIAEGTAGAATHAGGGGDIEFTGLAATYSVGDVTLAVEKQKKEQASTSIADQTTMSVNYAMGPLSVAVATTTDDTDSVDQTAVKFLYAF